MAVIDPVQQEPIAGRFAHGAERWLWETVGDSDTTTSIAVPGHSDVSVQVSGTFGGATIAVQGSNDDTNFVTLADFAGASMEFTAAGINSVRDNVAYIKITTSGGSGSDVDVMLLGKAVS